MRATVDRDLWARWFESITAHVSETKIRIKTRDDLKRERRPVNPRTHKCWGWMPGGIVVAMLTPMHGVNAGTLLRTCEAAGACFVIPHYPWVPEALRRGYTGSQRGPVHWAKPNSVEWLRRERQRTGDERVTIIGVELADEAVRLADLPVRGEHRSIIVLGHEQDGIPPEMLGMLDVVVEIPMVGAGTTLNVAVAGSLVLYKLAGLI